MLKQQGSNRVYTRETDVNGRSVIRVEGTNRDENRAFVYMARHFRALGLPVPEVYWVSEDEMQYTQEDLGDTILFDHLDDILLLKRTLRALAHIQVEGAQNFNWSMCFPVESMDERSIRWDLNYFKYCFLKGTKIEFSEPKLEDDFDKLVKVILAQPADTFLYRDFQSRNVMVKDGQPYFIDFQGGRRGPTQYDVVSFLWQAKASFPQTLRDELIEVYLDELEKLKILISRERLFQNYDFKINRDEWLSILPHFVLFRTLQVLGAYGYRGYFERKPHFLESIPLALRNLSELFEQHNRLGAAYPEIKRLAATLIDPLCSQNRRSTDGQPTVKANVGLTVTVYSFSFKKGLPADESGNGGGYVFDCRSTHNPGKYEEYKTLTGLDEPVIDFLEKDGEILTFLEHVDALVAHHVERFMERGFEHLQVAFGCTGGQHRSVYCAEHLAKYLKEKYAVKVHLIHRERGIEQWLE